MTEDRCCPRCGYNLINNRITVDKENILKANKARVLRPWEVELLIKAIPKKAQKNKFETLLYTGARYKEICNLLEHPELFEPENKRIHFTNSIITKGWTIKDRYVILNDYGCKVIEKFFEYNKPLPHWNTWRENLARWAKSACIDNRYLHSQTTRKTWESWLFRIYPHLYKQILSSIGHTANISVKHDLCFSFTDIDVIDMKKYVAGWEA